MMRHISNYECTGNVEEALRALQLKQRMTKPYKIRLRIKSEAIEYCFSPLIAIERIEDLSRRLAECKTFAEANSIVEDFDKYSHTL